MTDETLKPCPWCGGKCEIMHMLDGWSIGCDWYNHRDADHKLIEDCKIKPYSRGYATEQDAIKAWNTREQKEQTK